MLVDDRRLQEQTIQQFTPELPYVNHNSTSSFFITNLIIFCCIGWLVYSCHSSFWMVLGYIRWTKLLCNAPLAIGCAKSWKHRVIGGGRCRRIHSWCQGERRRRGLSPTVRFDSRLRAPMSSHSQGRCNSVWRRSRTLPVCLRNYVYTKKEFSFFDFVSLGCCCCK